ncbi:MAG: hypothetical protein WKG00_22125 [Polyangiaceae bacterium]
MLRLASFSLAPLFLTCLAGCGGDDLLGAAGPEDEVAVHNFPGDLRILEPARAAFIEQNVAALVQVRGEGAGAELTIGEETVTPAEDGSFTATIAAVPGLNLLRVVSGEDAVDTPFVYGTFAPATEAVPAAVAVRINEQGFASKDGDEVSLEMLANRALEDVDLLAALKGQKLSGSVAGAKWTFDVQSATYGKTEVELGPREGGATFEARINDVRVEGKLSVKVFGVGPSGDVSLTADAAEVGGDIGVRLTGSALDATASEVQTTLEGFQYHSGNAGFPCCVDDIMTGILRPKIEDAAQTQVRDALRESLVFALSQLALPEEMDLQGAGFPATITIDEEFDGAKFAKDGAQLTAAVRFHHAFAATDPGAQAPGWLKVGKAPGEMSTDPAFGVSISIDALNQALFAAWGQNGLERSFDDVPLAGTLHLAPRLPPLVLADAAGNLHAAAGEIDITAEVGGSPVHAALTIQDPVGVHIDAATSSLVLTPGPEPKISITWLEDDGLTAEFRQTVESMAIDMLPSLLGPVELPIPSIALGAVAKSFGDDVAVLGSSAKLSIDGETSRASIEGALTVVH